MSNITVANIEKSVRSLPAGGQVRGIAPGPCWKEQSVGVNIARQGVPIAFEMCPFDVHSCSDMTRCIG